MSYKKRVVESTARISIQDVRHLIGKKTKVIELALTHSDMLVPYYVQLSHTPCHFGGKRSWFCCGLCSKRCGSLYLSENENSLFCRSCAGLRYSSQTRGKSERHLLRYFDLFDRAEAVFEGLQRVTFLYRGQPTRRFRRYLRYRQKTEHLSRLLLS